MCHTLKPSLYSFSPNPLRLHPPYLMNKQEIIYTPGSGLPGTTYMIQRSAKNRGVEFAPKITHSGD